MSCLLKKTFEFVYFLKHIDIVVIKIGLVNHHTAQNTPV